MTTTEIVVSGFGGQGALFAGQLLAEAAMQEGKHVTWLPSYGPEMRGGTAHCVVIVSDELIGSPIVERPRVVLALNQPSMDKYEPLLAPGGLIIWNQSLIDPGPSRADLVSIPVPANQIAEELGTARMANVVMAGALLGAQPVIAVESFLSAIEDKLPEKHRALLGPNQEAVRRGLELGIPHRVNPVEISAEGGS